MSLALLSLTATTLISTAAANGNFLVNLTDIYYPANGCANACITEVDYVPSCNIDTRSCWCNEPGDGFAQYACCFAGCAQQSTQEAINYINEWCSSVSNGYFGPPSCATEVSSATPSASSPSSSSPSSDSNSSHDEPGLSTGAKSGIAIAGVIVFLAILVFVMWLYRRRSLKIPAAAPEIPLQRARTPPPPYLPPYSEELPAGHRRKSQSLVSEPGNLNVIR